MEKCRRKASIVSAIITIAFLATPALADVTNGDFQNGNAGWSETSDPGLGVTYPPGGGDPDAYAHMESDFTNLGGSVCISQTFICGDPNDGTECTMGFSYNLMPIDAVPGSAQITVNIDGFSDVVTDVATTGWEDVAYVQPCGTHTIEICMVVDPSNNAWIGQIDTVRAVCTGGVSNENDNWGTMKTRYR